MVFLYSIVFCCSRGANAHGRGISFKMRILGMERAAKGGPDMIRIHNQRFSRRTGEKRNYERTFVAEILAGAVLMNGTVAPSDGFTTIFISVLAGTGAT